MRLPRPATVISIIALFVSLTSGAYATGQARIGSPQIANRSIKLVDMHPSAVKALKGQRGPRGFAGPQGDPGFNGANGAPGASGPAGATGGFDPNKVSYITGDTISIAPGSSSFVITYCPSGSKAIAGGFVHISGAISEVWGSYTSSGTSWTVHAANGAQFTNSNLTGYAICARP